MDDNNMADMAPAPNNPNLSNEDVDTADALQKASKSPVISKSKWVVSYVFGEAQGLRAWCASHGPFCVAVSCFLRGVGQVVFMDNPLTGFLIFVCLALSNYYSALLAVVGGLTNYVTAVLLLGTDYLLLPTANYLNNGIFCYNGILVGLMCGTFAHGLNTAIGDENGYLVFLKLLPCCIIMSYVCTSMHVGMTNVYPRFPVFTFPFNFAGFLWLPISLQITWIQTSSLRPYVPSDQAAAHVANIYDIGDSDIDLTTAVIEGVLRGPVQIYLCSDMYSGIMVIVAMAICNWRASILCVFGSCIGSLFAILIGVDLSRVAFGLHSYNSALTMVGVACIFARLNRQNFISGVLHCCICVFIELALQGILASTGIPYLTLPFCLSTMFFSVFAFRKKQEKARKMRETKLKKKEEMSDFPQLSKLRSIRGAPTKLDRCESDWDDMASDENIGHSQRKLEKQSQQSDLQLSKMRSIRGAPSKLDTCESDLDGMYGTR